MSRDDVDDDDAPEYPGAGLVNAVWAGTGVYAAVAIAATIAPDWFATVCGIVSGALFVIGCIAFFWAYVVAVQRSRTDLIGIGGLYFLIGTAPKVVRFRMLGALVLEVVVATVSSSIRLFTPLAFGFLVPVFGLGLCGLWGARHGVFAPRRDASDGDVSDDDVAVDDEHA
jgi:hypothetical protein